jgi:hypothetical protein
VSNAALQLADDPIGRAFLVLKKLGRPGEYVWRVARGIEDYDERLAYLQQAISWLRAKLAESRTVRYVELPVDFRTFVQCELLLNKKAILWPKVVECGQELNNGKYVEAVLSGGIGVAKTTLAIYTQSYQLYVLSCMANPHELFDLDPSSEILIVFQSVNKNLAMDVDYRRFRDMVGGSPYFSVNFPFDTDRQSDMRFANNIVVKPISGQDTGALGQNVIGGIIDEVNFMAVVEDSKMKRDGTTYDQAVENYNAIARRRESRFMKLGALPGMLCLVSSKNYPGGMTDMKVAEARENKLIYVYDKRLWELRPDRFCGEFFRVFVGDETRKPRVMDEDEVVVKDDEHLVVAVPIEYSQAFKNDLIKAIRDIAGYSTQALHPFILDTDAVARCFGKSQSICSREDADFQTTHIDLLPKRIEHPTEPRFIHIDLATSKDSAGLCCGHVVGFKHMDRGDYQETLPIIQLDIILEVKPPPGGEILYAKLRSIVYVLRDTLHVPVKWVSFDQFQSTDSQQILAVNGFVTGYQSVDTDTHAYDMTKQAFYDDRVLAPAHAKAQKELCTLEYDAKAQKIDHPPNGSKDTADAIAGVIFGLTMRREIWLRHGIPLSRIPPSLAAPAGKNSVTAHEKSPEAYMDLVRRARGVEVGVRRDDE